MGRLTKVAEAIGKGAAVAKHKAGKALAAAKKHKGKIAAGAGVAAAGAGGVALYKGKRKK